MKVTKNYLKQLISEEIRDIRKEIKCKSLKKDYNQAVAVNVTPHDTIAQAQKEGCEWLDDLGVTASDKAAQQKTPPDAAADKGGSLQDEIDTLKTAVKDVLAKLEEL